MNVISLDPSLRSFGVYSVRDGVESSEVRRIPAKVHRLDALGKLLSWLSRLSDAPWDLCIVEDYAFEGGKKNFRGGTIQPEVGGIARGMFRARGIPVLELDISIWKAVTGLSLKKGTAMHDADYLNACAALYGKRFDTTDQVDAFLFYQTVKKCGTETPIGPGPSQVRQRLEELKINAREM